MKSTPSLKQLSKIKPVCIWSQAGVIERQTCDENFECGSCEIDKDLCRAANHNKRLKTEGKIPDGDQRGVVYWKEKLRELPTNKRLCLHHMKGRIDFKTCTNEYSCVNCDFDQYFYDQYSVHAVIKPVDVLDLDGFKVPQGYYFHQGHTWAKLEENAEVRIGIDDFALRLLGPPDGIESPLVGKEIQQGQAQLLFKRGPNMVAMKSPVSGIVTAVNTELRENGGLANGSPYTKGWVLRVHSPNLRSEIKNLIMGDEEKELLGKEIEILYQMIETHVQPLAADGGHLLEDIYGSMPGLGWDRLVKAFFS